MYKILNEVINIIEKTMKARRVELTAGRKSVPKLLKKSRKWQHKRMLSALLNIPEGSIRCVMANVWD